MADGMTFSEATMTEREFAAFQLGAVKVRYLARIYLSVLIEDKLHAQTSKIREMERTRKVNSRWNVRPSEAVFDERIDLLKKLIADSELVTVDEPFTLAWKAPA